MAAPEQPIYIGAFVSPSTSGIDAGSVKDGMFEHVVDEGAAGIWAPSYSPAPALVNPAAGLPDGSVAGRVKANIKVPLTRDPLRPRRFVPVGRESDLRSRIPSSYGDGFSYVSVLWNLTTNTQVPETGVFANAWSVISGSADINIRNAELLAAASAGNVYGLTWFSTLDTIADYVAIPPPPPTVTNVNYDGPHTVSTSDAAFGVMGIVPGVSPLYRWTAIDGAADRAAAVAVALPRPFGAAAAATVSASYRTSSGLPADSRVDFELRGPSDAVVATASGLVSTSIVTAILTPPGGFGGGRLVAVLTARGASQFAEVGRVTVAWSS